jgi:hypothetical protein
MSHSNFYNNSLISEASCAWYLKCNFSEDHFKQDMHYQSNNTFRKGNETLFNATKDFAPTQLA